jgi:hypothetical protein
MTYNISMRDDPPPPCKECSALRQERDNWCALAAAANADLLAARHDIERHVQIAAEQAEEIEKLRALLLTIRSECDAAHRAYDHDELRPTFRFLRDRIDAALRREETCRT